MNAAEKLAHEIERVSSLREMYRDAGRLGGPQACVGPAVALMTESLDRAKRAMGADDAIETLRAIQDLQGWTE